MSHIKIDADQLKRLSKKRTLPWVRDICFDWAIIVSAIGIALSMDNFAGYVAALFVVGNRQHALAIIGHDGTHFSLFKNQRLNDLLTDLLVFFPIGLSTSGYRNLHFAHHKHTNTEHDPELQHRSSKAPQWDLPNGVARVISFAVMDLVGYSVSDYRMIALASCATTRSARYGFLAFHATWITAFVMTGMWIVPVLWYSSLVTTFMMFFRLRTWLEHQGTEDTHRLHLNLFERAVLSPHNAWYHYEHHKRPAVPYYNLPALRKIMPGPSVMTLSDLLKFYRLSAAVRSGTPLKITP